MDENELRAALRETIVVHPEPPPMESATAIAVGRRAGLRRNLLAGTGAAAAILGITLAVIPGQSRFSEGTSFQPAADPSRALQPFPTGHPVPNVSWADGTPTGDETKPSWPPEGNGDATADTGEHYDAGEKLLAALVGAVPDGYTARSGSTTDGVPFRSHQATIEGDFWRYTAAVGLGKGDATGELVVEVSEPGNDLPEDACAVARAFWSRGGTCTPISVGKLKVGVVRESDGTSWAGYRHSDGTVVYVMQSVSPTYADPARPGSLTPLPALPLGDAALAALATDDSFR
jgi:hypothetical protein